MREDEGKLKQTFFPIPHPSGLVVDEKKKRFFVASTRNPNRIIEFRASNGYRERIEVRTRMNQNRSFFVPSREKYFPGVYYFHDLAIIGEDLFANSVGQNGIVKIDFNSPETDEIVWWPKFVEREKYNPDKTANFVQLNSIAAGRNLEDSFFTASSESISNRRPGHKNYPVDCRGVVISGKTREVVARGLTRPHSARIYRNKIWVDNSGYGEFGFIEKGKFIPVIKLPGWTRGLHIVEETAFVGVSRVLPKFSQYAPGLKKSTICGVFAIDLKDNKILGSITWPYGNQIFTIDSLSFWSDAEFPYEKVKNSLRFQKDIFYCYN